MEKISFIQDNGSFVDVKIKNSFNKGSKNSLKLLGESIKHLGCARSIVIDSQNNVIIGDKTVKSAFNEGIKKAIVIETDGSELVIVKRVDVLPETKKQYEISLTDNLIQAKSLQWDSDNLFDAIKKSHTFDVLGWGGRECLVKELQIEDLLKNNTEIHVKKEAKESILDVQMSLFD